MKSFYNWLMNKFNWNQKPKVQEPTINPPPEEEYTTQLADNEVGFIRIIVTKDARVNFEIDWAKSDKNHAIMFGTMLYYLNNGMLAEQILGLLLDIQKETKDKKLADFKFIRKVIKRWKDLLSIQYQQMAQTNNTDTPLIPPTQFFNPQNLIGGNNKG